MLLNNKIESPYNKFAQEGPVPIISKSLVKSKLSNKFYEMTSNQFKENNLVGGQNFVNSGLQNNKHLSRSVIENNIDEEKEEISPRKEKMISKGNSNKRPLSKMTRESEHQYESNLDGLKEVINKMRNELKVKILIIIFKIILFYNFNLFIA